MMTGRSCMKVVGRLSEPSLLMLSGKRSMRNGQRDQQRNFPSGLVKGQARKLVMLRLLRVRKRVVKKHQQTKKIMMKRKKKRRKRKKMINTFLTCFHSEASPTDAQDYIGSSLLLW